MASVRKRTWADRHGRQQTAWLVDYYDQHGKRQRRQFSQKRNADALALTAQVELRDVNHVPDADSITIAKAGEQWIRTAEQGSDSREPLERSTIEQYEEHLQLHINPFIGSLKLSRLHVPVVRDSTDKLRRPGRSAVMARYLPRSLASLIADAQRRVHVVRNPVRDLRSTKKGSSARGRGSALKVGIDIPTPDEISTILQHTSGGQRAFLLTAVFSGLRASELRGLSWTYGVDLKRGELHVVQRADRFNKIGQPKTKAAERTIPLPPQAVAALREWRLGCPKGALDLVFPNAAGEIEYLVNVVQRIFWPAQIAAGVVTRTVVNGQPVIAPKYTGLHSLRHFF